MKRATVLLLAVAIAMIQAAPAAEPGPLIRTHLDVPADLWVGQKAVLVVELAVPGYFAGDAAFDLPRLPGVLIMPPQERPVLGSEEHAGASYSVQRHELFVYAERPGTHAIPAFSVRFGFRPAPLAKDATQAVLKTSSVQLEAKQPPGANKLAIVISARGLETKETWNPTPGKAKVGDAFQHVITTTASDVPSMIFPPLPAPKVDGLGIYVKEPEVLDTNERGSMTGRRRETVTYICERVGQFVIPASRFTWWDLDSQKLRTVDFPQRILDVAPNPSVATSGPGTPSGNRSWEKAERRNTLVCMAIVALAVGLFRRRQWFTPFIEYWRPVHLADLNPPARDK